MMINPRHMPNDFSQQELIGIYRRAFGQVVREARSDKNIGVSRFAHLIGCTDTLTKRIENGEVSPPVDLIWSIAHAIGIQPDHFILKVHLMAVLIARNIRQERCG